jgi:NADPH:quinone reductase-like Zn-dependent oxidoreductase
MARAYGPPEVVRIEEVERPRPGPGELLVRVRASTVSSGDHRLRSLEMPPGFGLLARPLFGWFRPRQPVLGTELAGEVAELGEGVTGFAVGDRVFAFPGVELGCHAQYRIVPARGRIAAMPASLSFEQAAALSFGGTTALHFLRELGRLEGGESLLVVGASGAVGSAAVQLGKVLGAKVTGVTSGPNLELVRALGAERVIDYTRERLGEGGATYDVILDTVGNATIASYRPLLRPGGRLLLAAAGLWQLVAASWISATSELCVRGGNTPERVEDLHELAALAEAGSFVPLIDRSFPLERIAEAHARVATGHKRGSVVVTMNEPTAATS